MSPAGSRHCVVLDTNVVLDLLQFRDPRVAGLANALLDGRVRALTDSRCAAELERVLSYAAFSLDQAARAEVMRQYRASVADSGLTEAEDARHLPSCSDPDDQKFLELAWRTGADLLTRDKALLGLRRGFAKLGGGRIGKPEELYPHLLSAIRLA
ncbi:MAG: putative toxin-antitoxin system toxin component, PIN family [Betaproteobacteria bacterium RIFCSPLOWO2_02_FULL_62_17]|nr:MAG: putative toxin-antitoxin system toxin component, PIN family [Betaproteobacteria bacterium RIFCSPLOWO2_02_FULL_62_17]